MSPITRDAILRSLSAQQVRALTDIILYGDIEEAPNLLQIREVMTGRDVQDIEAYVRTAIANTIVDLSGVSPEEIDERLTFVL